MRRSGLPTMTDPTTVTSTLQRPGREPEIGTAIASSLVSGKGVSADRPTRSPRSCRRICSETCIPEKRFTGPTSVRHLAPGLSERTKGRSSCSDQLQSSGAKRLTPGPCGRSKVGTSVPRVCEVTRWAGRSSVPRPEIGAKGRCPCRRVEFPGRTPSRSPWQSETEFGALSQIALHPDSPVVPGHDLAADGQSHSAARILVAWL
jgi:hypothetical protein